MYTLSYVLYGIGGVAVLILLGFTIALFKKKGTTKTNKIAIIISVLVAVASFGYGGYHQYDINQTIEAADDEFADNAEKFTKLYFSTSVDLEKAGANIGKEWEEAANEADENDEDFDVEKTVISAASHNAETIVSSDDNVKKLKKYLQNMDDYDTGNYDYEAYKNAYNSIKDMLYIVKYPSGTLSDYHSKYNRADEKVSKDYDEIKDDD